MPRCDPAPRAHHLAYLAITIAFSIVISTVTSIFGITGAILGSETVGFFSVFISLIPCDRHDPSGRDHPVRLLCLLSEGIQTRGNRRRGVVRLLFPVPQGLRPFFVDRPVRLAVEPAVLHPRHHRRAALFPAFFILAENPEKGIRECVNESKQLMSGRCGSSSCCSSRSSPGCFWPGSPAASPACM